MALVKNEEIVEKDSSQMEIANENEDEDKEIFGNMAKSETSQEESEGKNIFKTKRDFSDEDESDEDDVHEKDRGHKRRKTSNQNSLERENSIVFAFFFFLVKIKEMRINLKIKINGTPKNKQQIMAKMLSDLSKNNSKWPISLIRICSCLQILCLKKNLGE